MASSQSPHHLFSCFLFTCIPALPFPFLSCSGLRMLTWCLVARLSRQAAWAKYRIPSQFSAYLVAMLLCSFTPKWLNSCCLLLGQRGQSPSTTGPGDNRPSPSPSTSLSSSSTWRDIENLCCCWSLATLVLSSCWCFYRFSMQQNISVGVCISVRLWCSCLPLPIGTWKKQQEWKCIIMLSACGAFHLIWMDLLWGISLFLSPRRKKIRQVA